MALKKLCIILCLLYALSACTGSPTKNTQSDNKDTLAIKMWNGNRSDARQKHELAVLEEVLKSARTAYGPYKIIEDTIDYPGNEESFVFSKYKHDVFVTIAGNQKFDEDSKITVDIPIAKGILGYRIPIVRAEEAHLFADGDSEKIKNLKIGVPLTWSDAIIFRQNGYHVVEKGNFDDILNRLKNKEFDYTAFGANEVINIYETKAPEGLVIDKNVVLYYPFPLVFYVNPDKSRLAKRVTKGLKTIEHNGTLDSLFNAHYRERIKSLHLNERKMLKLDNPMVPEAFNSLMKSNKL